MNPGPITVPKTAQEASDHITVLVFKDNFAARTFQVPLRWVTRFGIAIGILSGIAAISFIFAFKYYRLSSQTDISRVQEMEQEIYDLRAHIKTLEKPTESTTQASAPSTSVTSASSASSASDDSEVSEKTLQNFTLFSSKVKTDIPDPATLSFSIQNPSVTWRGSSLRVRFALQYTREDQGNQEGRILILARGPSRLLSYPNGTLSKLGAAQLVLSEKGEFFSVSRYREVKADFSPVGNADSIQDVEIFIFNSSDQLLVYKHLSPPKASSAKPEKEKVETTETEAEPAQ